jgi:hypothetical protein
LEGEQHLAFINSNGIKGEEEWKIKSVF